MKFLAENLTWEDGNVSHLENVSDLLNLFDLILLDIELEEEIYEDIKDVIDEYEFFEEIR